MQVATITPAKEISLYFSEGSSDKEYHAQLKSQSDGFVVNFQYGRRGSSLTTGSKTKDPLPFEKAEKVYNKLVAEKMGKGYTPALSGAVYQDTPVGGNFTGIAVQLLNAIGEDDLETCLRSSKYMMQQKFDGERRPVDSQNTSDTAGVVGINRRGLAVALPQEIAIELNGLNTRAVFDGEQVGNKYYVFDLLEIGGEDIRHKSAEDRYHTLVGLCQLLKGNDNIEVVECAFTEEAKRALFEKIKAAGLEGVVFKDRSASYTPGRPNSGGDQLKFKFWESATLEVAGPNGEKRSVALQGYDANGVVIALGSVTISPDKAIPEAGAIVEVKYLYAYKGGSVYQPEYLGLRGDMTRDDCTLSQLKYKPESQDADIMIALKNAEQSTPRRLKM